MKKFFVIIISASLLIGCGTLKNLVGPEKKSAKSLSTALETINAKVPQYVSQIFTDSMTNEKIITSILLELREPLKGYSEQLYEEWVTYSNANSGKKNSEYATYTMQLTSAKGDLSKLVSDKINGKLPRYFTEGKTKFKSCRSTSSADTCKQEFVNGIQKNLSTTIEETIKKYLEDRLKKL
jgi:hypothetical protein